MPDCIFCKVVKKEVPADVVFEDDTLIVFKDIHPVAPVHLLIVPKEHIPSLAHLAENHANVISAMIYRAKAIALSAGLPGYRLVFNVGKEGGQLIDHLHLHVVGGWENKNPKPANGAGLEYAP